MNKAPIEVSKEDAMKQIQLRDILDEKAKIKLDLKNTEGLHLIKRTKFYYNKDNIREHIASYKGYAILIKQEKIKEEENKKETRMFPSLILIQDLKLLKRVNGNIVRKLKPKSLHEHEKLALMLGVMKEVDILRKL